MNIDITNCGRYRRWYHTEFRDGYQATIHDQGWDAEGRGKTARQATRRAKKKLAAARRVQTALNQVKGNDTDHLRWNHESLREQVRAQHATIEDLRSMVAELQDAREAHERNMADLRTKLTAANQAIIQQEREVIALSKRCISLVRGLDLSDEMARKALKIAKRRARKV